MTEDKNSNGEAGLWRTYDVDPHKIEELRVACYEYAKAHPDEIDIEDMRNRIDAPEDVANNNIRYPSNWMLKRFLISSHRDVQEALERFKTNFRFRHEYHVFRMTRDNVLPREFYHLLPLDDGGFDMEGNRVLVIRLKYYKKIPQFDLLIRRAIVYFAETHDISYENGDCKGVVIFFDCLDFKITQVDFDLLKFAILAIPHNYVGLVKYCVVCDLPFLLGYVLKMIEAWMPTDKNAQGRKFLHTTTRKQLHELLTTEERAEFLGGKRYLSTDAPKEAIGIDEFMKSVEDLEPGNMKKIGSYVQELVQIYK